MGRKAIPKLRLEDPGKKAEWIAKLVPHMEQGGLKSITTEQVAKFLGVSKATLYQYYKSRNEILADAVEYKLNSIRQYKFALQNKSIPYLDRYFEAVKMILTNLSGISSLFLADLKDYYPRLWNKVEHLIDESNDVLKSYYEEGSETGIFKDIDPSILILSDRLFFAALTNPEFLIQNNITIEKAFSDYFRLKMEGLLANKTLSDKIAGKVSAMLTEVQA